MPGPTSKLSRSLANVKVQLKKQKTRGVNPRDLRVDEIRALEARRDQLQAEMLEAMRQRLAARVNAHTAAEADQTRTEVREESQDAGPQTRDASQDATDHSEDTQVEDKVDRLMEEIERKRLLDKRVTNEVDQYMAALERKKSKR